MAQRGFLTTSLLLVDGICRLRQPWSLAGKFVWMEFLRAQDPLYQAPETGTYILPECPANCDIGVRGFDSSRTIHIAS